MKETKTKNKFYSWHIDRQDDNIIIIYEQNQEDKNSYNCIRHITEQLIQENNQYKFHLINN